MWSLVADGCDIRPSSAGQALWALLLRETIVKKSRGKVMAYFGGDNEFYQLGELLKGCQISNQVDKRLELTSIICRVMLTQTLDEPMEKMIREMEKYTRTLLTDSQFMKKVHRRHALSEREPITYYGGGSLKDDEYDYDEPFEKQIVEIEFKITTFLGNIWAFIQSEGAV